MDPTPNPPPSRNPPPLLKKALGARGASYAFFVPQGVLLCGCVDERERRGIGPSRAVEVRGVPRSANARDSGRDGDSDSPSASGVAVCCKFGGSAFCAFFVF